MNYPANPAPEPVATTAEAPRKYPRRWMQLFLDLYRYTGRLNASAKMLHLVPGDVFRAVARYEEFAADFEIAQAAVAERLWSWSRHRVIASADADLGRN